MLHRAVAERMLTQEGKVLQTARNNLTRWLNSDDFARSEATPLLEWQKILDESTPEEIRTIIIEDTDEGQRLRSSSPFTGILTESERNQIWSECAEIIPV